MGTASKKLSRASKRAERSHKVGKSKRYRDQLTDIVTTLHLLEAKNNNTVPQCPSPLYQRSNRPKENVTLLKRPKSPHLPQNPSESPKTLQPKPLAQREKEYTLARSKIFNQLTKVYKHPNHPHRISQPPTPRAPSPVR